MTVRGKDVTARGDRFVRLLVPGEERPVFVTFLPATEPEIAEDHPVLASFAATDPEKAERLRRWMNELIAHNDRFFEWLEASPENSRLFAEDPVAALQKALPDVAPID